MTLVLSRPHALPHEALYGENGRGMLLADRLARRWGALATSTGKQVWARV